MPTSFACKNLNSQENEFKKVKLSKYLKKLMNRTTENSILTTINLTYLVDLQEYLMLYNILYLCEP